MAGQLITSKGTYEHSPGVGSYNTGGNLAGGAGSSPGKSFGNLTKPQNYYPPTHGPGPGGYGGSGLNLADSAKSGIGKNRSASYSMGSILPNVAFNQANISPGPGAYGSPGFRSSLEGK